MFFLPETISASFWALAGLISFAALALMLAPLLRRPSVDGRAAHDTAAYRAQLNELDRDVARGLLTAEEAESARIEVSRKLLSAADAASAEAMAAPAPRAVSYGLAALLAIGTPAAAGALYLSIGSPGEPDRPFAARTAGDDRLTQEQAERLAADSGALPDPAALATIEGMPDFETLLTRLEDQLEERPGDVRGLDLLARTYLRMGRPGDAWRAYGRLIEASDAPSAGAFAGMGEAMVFAAGGYISPEAEGAFTRALALDAADFRARHYRALTHAQQGRAQEALEGWTELLREADGSEPWYAMVRARAGEAAQQLSLAPDDILPPAPRGPDAEAMRAAADMTPEERTAMIEGMVAGLAERLAEEPDDLPGWQRLIRAYRVMDRAADADAALERARAVFAGDDAALQALQ